MMSSSDTTGSGGDTPLEGGRPGVDAATRRPADPARTTGRPHVEGHETGHGEPNDDIGRPARAGLLGPHGAARPPSAMERPRGMVAGSRSRRAQLQLARVDPWSVMKTALLFSLCVFIMLLVATMVVWYVLDRTGVFDSIVRIADNFPSLDAKSYLSFSRFVGTATFFGAINVVLTTALSTVVAIIYNLCSRLVGGIEVTLAETPQ